jgi:hypothetical protein
MKHQLSNKSTRRSKSICLAHSEIAALIEAAHPSAAVTKLPAPSHCVSSIATRMRIAPSQRA